MTNPLLDFSRYESADSKFNAELGSRGGYINFSNSGKGGDKKYFTLSLDSFLSVLKNINENIDVFAGHENYVEKDWRDLGSEYYEDGTANAMCTVQTKPMFTTLSKIIIWANSPILDNLNPEQNIDLSSQCIENAIQKLTQLAENYTPDENLNSLQNNEDEKLVEENNSIRDFALNVFKHFYGQNWLEVLDNTTSKPSNINTSTFTSHDFGIFKRLIAEFSLPQTKENLTSAKTQRYFDEPIYQSENKYYYFTTQWNGVGEYDLSFNGLKSFFENKYQNYRFENNNQVYKLFKLGILNKIPFNHNTFHKKTDDAGLIFSNQLIQRFVASLCTKPFVICSGLSGSGKTKLAQAFAQWICYKENAGEKNEQYCIVPVGADWTNREPLLGYPNALEDQKYVKPENGVLDIILRAKANETKPYFLILDEMNLSHVERYFADFLSTMESGDSIPLHTIKVKEGAELVDVPQSICLPKNLFIIGTVNIDETTYMFSPKVLDRANTIEFRLTESDLTAFFDSTIPLNMDLLKGTGENMGESFVAMATQKTDKNFDNSKTDLTLFFNELKKSGAEFGYRTASEIGRLMFMLEQLGEKDDNLLDIAIMQKLLPKLHGSRNKLTKILPVLGGFCLTDKEKIKENYFEKLDEIKFSTDGNIKYKISFEKICRMYKNAMENGFASYAEA